MKCFSVCSAAMVAVLASGPLQAETEAEYQAGAAASASAPVPARRSTRPAFFAPDAARTAARLPPEQRAERAFLRAAAAASRFGAMAGTLALARSNNNRVREMATELINHHNASRDEMQHLLHARDMAMPMLDDAQSRSMKLLNKLAGARFDREFMERVGLEMPQEAIRQYEKALPGMRDPVLTAWAERQLPTLRYQLAVAERAMPGTHRLVQGERNAAALGARPANVKPVAVQQPIGSSSR
jgi:putative membrane protein